MRRSNRGRRVTAAAGAVSMILLAACGTAVTPPPSATPEPTPLITPDPHLSAPASVDEVFRLLGAAGIRITPNTATTGVGGEPVKRINATYASWPLVLTEFTSADALLAHAGFDEPGSPGFQDTPYALAGLNILVEYGPRATTNDPPEVADAARREAFRVLALALDALVGPLAQRSVEPVLLPSAPAS